MFASTGRKYPYFPNYEMKMHLTPFRSCQVDCPDLYKDYTGEGSIIKVDCLYAVHDLIPIDNSSRQRAYLLLSGDCSDVEMQQLLTRYYKTCPTFQNHVDEIFMVRPDKLLTGIIKPLRDLIADYVNMVDTTIKGNGGKFLMMSHDYVYYKVSDLPKLPGVEVVKQ